MTTDLNDDTALRFREGLNKAQVEAVEHCDGPLLVIAGAGTGKTSVVTRRIARLIEKGVNPSKILALTFTEKAANEMEERVDRLVPYGYSAVWISTFHSFGDRVLRDNAIAIGLAPDFKVLNVAECVIFLKENIFELPLDYYRPSGNPAKYLSELVRFIGRLKDEDISPEAYSGFAKGLEKSGAPEDYVKQQSELAASYAKYNELMAGHGYVDYGDQISLALRLFRARPSVLERYREKFSYILADEFQDTNYAQFELIKLLTGKRRNVTVVADDDQSIYKFRGAAISNVLNFKDVYPDAKEITLTENYRSAQPILDAAYRLIRHNDPDRLEVKSGINKKLVSIRNDAPGTSGVRSLHLDTITNEVDSVCKIIEDGVKSGKRNLRDFAILVRANSDAVPFLRELALRGIEHGFSGSSGLYSRDEIRLLICFLRAITDHSDNLSLFHVAGHAPYEIKAEDLVPCHNLAKRRHGSLLNVMKDVSFGFNVPLDISPAGLIGIKRLYNDVARFSELGLRESTAGVLYSFLMETGYLSGISKDRTEETEEKVKNITRFFNIVTHMEETLGVRKPNAFVDYLNLLMEAGDDPPSASADFESDCVRVLTVHKSKGLEFPVVFMVGLVSGRFPRKGRSELIEIPRELIKDILPSGDFHLEEERRLFYVGMTRAKDELYLTSAVDYGGARGKKMSQFVIEALDVPRAVPLKTKPMEAILKYAPAAGSKEKALPLPDDAPVHLSAYQIDDYVTCPWKYRYAHVLNVPLLPHHTIMYGKAVHEAIAFYFRAVMEGTAAGAEDLVAVYKAAWRSEGFISRAHEEKRFAEGAAALRAFVERQKGSGIKPACVEKSFTVELGNVIVRGRFDLIEEREDGAHIIDFKTSDVREEDKAEDKAKKSLQLKVYALSYLKNFKKMPAGCELRFVDSGLTGAASFSDKDMDKTESLIHEVARGVRKRDYIAKPDYNKCNWCAFKDICDERYGA